MSKTQGTRELPWGYLALAGALVLAAGLFVVQSGLLGGGDDDADDDADAGTSVTAQVTATGTTEQVSSVPLPPTATVAVAAAAPTSVVSHPACEPSARLSARPAGLLVNDPAFTVWFGESGSDLAVAPIVLAGINHDLPDSGVYWFAEGPQPALWYGSEEPLTVEATLRDAGGSGADAGGFTVSEPVFRDQFTQGMDMTFPQPGCWEITATASEGDATTFAVQVAPFSARPDAVLAVSRRGAQPYAAPEACADPGWIGPSDPLGILWAAWWVEAQAAGETVAIGSDSTIFWANIESMFLVRASDDPTRVLRIDAVSSVDGSQLSTAAYRTVPGQALAPLYFGHPGCWTVHVRAGETTLVSVDVFVYPIDCRRESGQVPVPDGCTVLAGNP